MTAARLASLTEHVLAALSKATEEHKLLIPVWQRWRTGAHEQAVRSAHGQAFRYAEAHTGPHTPARPSLEAQMTAEDARLRAEGHVLTDDVIREAIAAWMSTHPANDIAERVADLEVQLARTERERDGARAMLDGAEIAVGTAHIARHVAEKEIQAAHAALDAEQVSREYVETDGDYDEHEVSRRPLFLAERIAELASDRAAGWGAHATAIAEIEATKFDGEHEAPSTETAVTLGIGKFSWRESTRDRHVATVGRSWIDVHRSRSWKKLGHKKPWRIELFGNPHVSSLEFAELDDAKYVAEKMAIEMLAKAAEAMGMVWRRPNEVALSERVRVAEAAYAHILTRLGRPGGMDTTWPIRDCVRKLVEAADHLMDAHDCDSHGWELVDTARKVARAWLNEDDRPEPKEWR